MANAEAAEDGLPAGTTPGSAPPTGTTRAPGGIVKPIGNDSHEVLKERLREQIKVLKGNRKDQAQGTVFGWVKFCSAEEDVIVVRVERTVT